MKRKINSLKLPISALTLALALMGGILPSCTMPGYPEPLPQQVPAEEEQSKLDMKEGVQPLSDLDEPRRQDQL